MENAAMPISPHVSPDNCVNRFLFMELRNILWCLPQIKIKSRRCSKWQSLLLRWLLRNISAAKMNVSVWKLRVRKHSNQCFKFYHLMHGISGTYICSQKPILSFYHTKSRSCEEEKYISTYYRLAKGISAYSRMQRRHRAGSRTSVWHTVNSALADKIKYISQRLIRWNFIKVPLLNETAILNLQRTTRLVLWEAMFI